MQFLQMLFGGGAGAYAGGASPTQGGGMSSGSGGSNPLLALIQQLMQAHAGGGGTGAPAPAPAPFVPQSYPSSPGALAIMQGQNAVQQGGTQNPMWTAAGTPGAAPDTAANPFSNMLGRS